MNVLSLFDGISCGQLALQRANIPVENYYASEIDKYAVAITQKNFPNTIQVGDVCNWRNWNLPKIDLLIGGSPCQGFSIAGTKLNFDDPRSRLFFTFCDVLNYIKPKWFMLENVKMKGEWQDVITSYLKVDPIEINSALVSAQNRKRLYWANIPNITQPENKNIKLEHILFFHIDKKFWLSKKERNYMDREVADGRNHWDFLHHSDTETGKSAAVVANFYKGVPYNVLIDRNFAYCSYWDCDFQDEPHSFHKNCVDGDCFQGENYPTSIVRKFHPIECERLQTLPDNYTQGISNTQRYKAIGNGWTVDVIAHILSFLTKP